VATVYIQWGTWVGIEEGIVTGCCIAVGYSVVGWGGQLGPGTAAGFPREVRDAALRRVFQDLPEKSSDTPDQPTFVRPPLPIPNHSASLISFPQHNRSPLPFSPNLHPPPSNLHRLHPAPRRPIPPDLASTPHVGLDRQSRNPLCLRHIRHLYEHDLRVDALCDVKEAGVEGVAYTVVPLTLLEILLGVGVGQGLRGWW